MLPSQSSPVRMNHRCLRSLAFSGQHAWFPLTIPPKRKLLWAFPKESSLAHASDALTHNPSCCAAHRADAPPGEGAPQLRPKHISFVMDVSGSMYYFNGCAQCRQPIARLERIVACDAMPEAMVWISVCMHTTIGPLVQI